MGDNGAIRSDGELVWAEQPPFSDSLERRSRDWESFLLASGGHRDPTMLTGNDCVKNDVYSRAYSKTSTSCGIFPLHLDLNHILFLPCLSAQCLLPWKGLQEPFAGGKKNKKYIFGWQLLMRQVNSSVYRHPFLGCYLLGKFTMNAIADGAGLHDCFFLFVNTCPAVECIN